MVVHGAGPHQHDGAVWSMMASDMRRTLRAPVATPRSGRARPAAGWPLGAGRVLLLVLLVLALLPLATSGLAQDASEDGTPTLDSELVAEALRILDERYVDESALTTENLTAGAIRGMVEALGDEGHTAYLTPEEYAAEQDALDGRVLGIGVLLDQRSRAPLVISVMDGSPADRAGLRAGDIIASVDGVEASRLPLDELARLVRGEAGTRVRLAIERPGEADPIDVTIVRESVEIEPASWARIPGSDVAVVRIVQFSQSAGARSREAIADALAAGAGGIVLDLRGNPGGLVNEAVDVVSAFLDGGVAYREASGDGSVRDVAIPDGRAITTDAPVIALVDYATASSAEIVAAALRDNERGVIVGEQTFGTGTVLNTFELSDGSALKVGVRTWLTPDGETVFRVGVRPDHEVRSAPGAPLLRPADLASMTADDFASSGDLALRRAVGLLEPMAAR
jgi:carboxyl-terminal processing protease